MRIFKLLLFIVWFGFGVVYPAWANEVLQNTNTEVVIREHPSSKGPYISIISTEGEIREDLLLAKDQSYSRPDYRLLDPNVKAKDVQYDGPVSSRKKVYVLAASLATLGVVGGVVGPAVLPATATTGAAGSGVGAGVGAVAVTGAAAAAVIKTSSDIPDDYQRLQESVLLETDNDFHRIHIQKQP